MNSTFAPFNSFISPGFWQKFSNIVLDNSAVERDRIPIWGYYGPSRTEVEITVFSVDHSSFDEKPAPNSNNQVAVRGMMILTKSIEDFKDLDKNALLGEFHLDEKKVEENPLALTPFVILTYADLKSYLYTYWFGFPAVSSVKISYSLGEPTPNSLLNILEEKDSENIWRQGFFMTDVEKQCVHSLKEGGDGVYSYLDPSGSVGIPGWVLRNFIAYIVAKRKLKSGDEIKVYSIRQTNSRSGEKGTNSLLIVKVEVPEDWDSNPKVLGWERTKDNKVGPKVADLKKDLDPKTLSESSVDFNLKLMKWNLFPEFNLDMMHSLKVCILGAGTLGCNVARCLMGWGVRQISIVDYGNVSYSNPVRQSLYHYKDSGKPKAAAAAEELQQIFPGVKATPYKIHIPMPGHPVSAATLEQATNDYNQLDNLIKENDVIFLLTDTRESRWAPSVIGAAHNKLIINAALGFDSYVVMRHGRDGEGLGCYFCTDVVAPGDSTKDRSLDQQCTVSRPGLSMIAGAFAVELLVSTLQNSSTLGPPAHTMRGFLSSAQYISPTFSNFDKCSACSKQVIQAYRSEGFEFIRRVMNDSNVLERVSGLDELMCGVEGIVELDSDSSE